MKLRITFYFLLIIVSNSFSQNKKSFEGIIKYDIQYLSKDTSKVREYLGDEAIVFIKQGNYKQEYPNAKFVKSDIYRQINSVTYRQDSNKYYYSFNDTDTMLVIDCSYLDDTIISITRSDSITEILKTKCKSITFQFKTKSQTYFYAKSLYVEPDFFMKHKYASYDRFAKETKSIYLKYIQSDAKSDLIMTATEINRTAIDDSVFNIAN